MAPSVSEQNDRAPCSIEMRLFKDAHEQDIIAPRQRHQRAGPHPRYAAQRPPCCAPGKMCANTTWTPSCCTRSATRARSTGLRPIVAAGGQRLRAALPRRCSACVRDGELVLIDAGCELDGYASDITRTFPANGKFTGPQRAL